MPGLTSGESAPLRFAIFLALEHLEATGVLELLLDQLIPLIEPEETERE